MGYRTDIDGLRAIAVVAVILFHAKLNIFKGGFVGVDVFFVISGFLIASIIQEDQRNHHFELIRFYCRRIRRIAPALIFVIFCCLPFAWLWLLPDKLTEFSKSTLSTLTFLSNIYFWRSSNYFDTQSQEMPLLHSWTLGVEAQYYLIYPIIVLVIVKLASRHLRSLILLLALASFGLANWAAFQMPVANFYLLPTRMWELLLGAFVALSLPHKNTSGNAPLAGLGLCAVLVSVFYFDEAYAWPSYYSALPVAGTALLLAYGRSTHILGRGLSWRPIRYIGLISYSAYLWHFPLFAFAHISHVTDPSQTTLLILSATSLLLAAITYRWIETPYRQSNTYNKPSTYILAAFMLASIVASGIFTITQQGYPARFKVQTQQHLASLDGTTQAEQTHPCHNFYQGQPEKILQPPCLLNTTAHSHDMRATVFLGDSHASAGLGGFAQQLPSNALNGPIIAGSWCAPLYEFGVQSQYNRGSECWEIMKTAYERILKNPEIQTVILIAEWPHYISGNRPGDEEVVLYRNAQNAAQNVAENLSLFEASFNRSVDLLIQHRKQVIIAHTVPEYSFNVAHALRKSIILKQPLEHSMPLIQYRERNASFVKILDRIKSKYPTLMVYQPANNLCNSETCSPTDDEGKPLYRDQTHLNQLGSAIAFKALIQMQP